MPLPFGLLFDERDLASIRAKSQTTWGAKLLADLRQACDRTLAADGGRPQPGPSREEGGGKALDYDFSATSGLAFLGLVLDSPVYLEGAKRRVLALAEREAWLWGQMLTCGMAATSIALALDWGWDAYSDAERRRVLDALIGCAIEHGDPAAKLNATPEQGRNPYALQSLTHFLDYRSAAPFHADLFTTNNWDMVTTAGLMTGSATVAAAMVKHGVALGTTRPLELSFDAARFDRWYSIAKERIQHFASRCFSSQGQYCEGPGYYTFGTENALIAIEVARRWRGENLYTSGLRASPDWHRELYPWDIARGGSNLNDSVSPAHPGPHIIARLAAENRSGSMQQFFFDLLASQSTSWHLTEMVPLTLIWADADLVPEPTPMRTFATFGETGDVVGRSGRDADRDLHWVFRCGKWNGAHTHRDRNSLTLSAFGERLLVDSGCKSGYFSDPHASWHSQTIGHNAILVDGVGQLGDNDAPTHGRLLRCDSRDGRTTVVGDAKQCYARTSMALRVVHEREGFLLVYDLVDAVASSFDCLWRIDNRDRATQYQLHGGIHSFVRPHATLAIVPVLAPEQVKTSAGWIESDAAASICLNIRRAQGRFFHLLVPLHPLETLPIEIEEASVNFSLRGRRHRVSVDAVAGRFVIDGDVFDFTQEMNGLPFSP